MSNETNQKQPPSTFFSISLSKEEAEFFQLGMSQLFHAAAMPRETSQGCFTSVIQEMHPSSFVLLQEMHHNLTNELIDR